jgi:pimeloyl-ACP methyl ester carboxylesterase
MKLILLFAAACSSASTTPKPPQPISVTVTGSGPPVILIPGLASPGSVWSSTVAHLANHYTCHVVTLAGFGGTPAIAPPMLASARDAVIHYIDEHHLDHPVLIGHSLGATLAMDIAITKPADVGKVLAVDGLPFFPAITNPAMTVEQATAIGQKIGGAIGSLTKDQYAAQALAYAKTQVTSEADAQTIAGWAKDVDPAAVGRAMSELFSRDLRADLARLQAPLLLLGSSADDNASAAEIYQQQIAAAPRHRFIHMTNARHFIMYDAPDRFLQIVERFLTCDDLKTCEL